MNWAFGLFPRRSIWPLILFWLFLKPSICIHVCTEPHTCTCRFVDQSTSPSPGFVLQAPRQLLMWGLHRHLQKKNVKNTVELGLYVHGLVRTLGYYVLSIDDRRPWTFFSDKSYRTWHNIGFYVPIFSSRSTFCPFLFFFLITSLSSTVFQFQISIPWYAFKSTMPWKTI